MRQTLLIATLLIGAAGQQQPMPPDETDLIAAVEKGTAAFTNAANDMAKGASRPARAKAICSAIKGFAARDWAGTVEKLSSSSQGDGVLEVRLSPTITVKTWNNGFSDMSDHTLIRAGTPLFDQAVALKVGSLIRFSGSFIRSDTDCLHEGSMTLQGSMEEPEFLFRFTAIQAK